MEVLACRDGAEWEAWLADHHALRSEVWLKIAKKGSGLPSVTISEALDVALCHGWIDGQRRSLDEGYYLQKYTPRRPRSTWSKVNVAKAEALVAAGRMRAPGMAAIEAAKADGRWAAAYDSASNATIPPDLAAALERDQRRAGVTVEPLRRRPPAAALAWAAAAVGAGSRVVRVRLLASSWLANHAVDVADPAGRLHRLVLRRWARPGWEVNDPTFTATREARALQLLAATPVPAPRLVAADPDAASCDVPALLLTRLRGRPPDIAADPRRLVAGVAAALPAIHAAGGAGAAALPAYHRFYDPPALVPPAWSARPGLWARALEAAAEASAPAGEPCLLHRDYHPGNTLWWRGRLVGVVDWNFASWGSPSVDLGHMRVNLATDLGPAWADEFLAAYRALTGFDHHPWWDLAAMVDVLPEWDPEPGPEVDRLEAFVAAALDRLGRLG